MKTLATSPCRCWLWPRGLLLVVLQCTAAAAAFFLPNHHHHHHHHAHLPLPRTTGLQQQQQQQYQQQAAVTPTTTRANHPAGSRSFKDNKTFLARKLATTATCRFASSSSNNSEEYDDICDVLVLGSGPAGRAIAALLAAADSNNQKGLDVVLADTMLQKDWPPNYGVWKDEWEAVLEKYQAAGVTITGGNCGASIDREWPVTDCYFGGSFDIPTEQRLRLDRPYYRMDRFALQQSLSPGSDGSGSGSTAVKYRTLEAKHVSRAINVNMYAPAGSLVHDETGSTIVLEDINKSRCTIRTKLIVDCTGHESRLVLKETRDPYRPPGFQIAYGCLVDVENVIAPKEQEQPDEQQAAASSTVWKEDCIGPYDREAMTLFDYRTDHYDNTTDAGIQEKVQKAPTFMYAMPLQGNRIFFEETSLVARPALSFQEAKDRCFQRLAYHGIAVTKLYEEEFCYIPMGGALPLKDQRVIALGGSAAMVHPSTGYHLCRCMMGAADVAAVIRKELSSSSRSNTDLNLDRLAATAYHTLWTPENIRQRNFAVFGGEFLMKQNVQGLRGFFDGFFQLPLEQWGGFLAGWPGLPNNVNHESWLARLWFGLNFVIRLPLPVALDMLASIVTYTLSEGVPLPQSVTPFFGMPSSYEYKRNTDYTGDVAAKQEARRMIAASAVVEDLPAAFEAATTAPIAVAKKSLSTTTVNPFFMQTMSNQSEAEPSSTTATTTAEVIAATESTVDDEIKPLLVVDEIEVKAEVAPAQTKEDTSATETTVLDVGPKAPPKTKTAAPERSHAEKVALEMKQRNLLSARLLAARLALEQQGAAAAAAAAAMTESVPAVGPIAPPKIKMEAKELSDAENAELERKQRNLLGARLALQAAAAAAAAAQSAAAAAAAAAAESERVPVVGPRTLPKVKEPVREWTAEEKALVESKQRALLVSRLALTRRRTTVVEPSPAIVSEAAKGEDETVETLEIKQDVSPATEESIVTGTQPAGKSKDKAARSPRKKRSPSTGASKKAKE